MREEEVQREREGVGDGEKGGPNPKELYEK